MTKNKVLPYFRLSLGYTIFYLSVFMLLPLVSLFFNLGNINFYDILEVLNNERIISALKLTIFSAFKAALANIFICTIIAWVLVRYNFKGKKFFDMLIDIPFALPTSIAGLTLASLYSHNGWFGRFLVPLGIEVAFSETGIIFALMFVGIPFVVRTIEPVLRDFSQDVEEAAINLGASRLQLFCYIIMPNIFPAILTAFVLSFARGLGEYGSVIFIAGNIPNQSEILPLVINIKLEQYDYRGAAILAITMLLISFSLIYIINMLQKWSSKHHL